MTYLELRSAVINAYRQRDYALCFALLDNFIEGSNGTDRGKALCFKASVIMWHDRRRAPEGLFLVDEALDYCEDDPAEIMRNVINALGLCYTLGDVHKARKYEAVGTRLLQEHGSHPDVHLDKHKLHGNLGLLAGLRGEYASAFWHFMHALDQLKALGVQDDPELQCTFLSLSLDMVDAALHLGRVPEAEEALASAKPFLTTDDRKVWWTAIRAKVLRSVGRIGEAADAVGKLDPDTIWRCSPAEQVHYYVMRGLIAQDEGDWPSYHRNLATAHSIAVENSLEYILCEIQRIQRTPLKMGVMS